MKKLLITILKIAVFFIGWAVLSEYRQVLKGVRSEVRSAQYRFYSDWNADLSKVFKRDIDIKRYSEIEGGFWLYTSDFDELESELKYFFQKRCVQREGRIFLRGYDYYENDPVMHKGAASYEQKKLLDILERKWESYEAMSFCGMKDDKVGFENWIGYLSFFEYCFHDLTSVGWLEFKCEEYFSGEIDALNIANVIEELTDAIANIIARLVKFEFDVIYEIAKKVYFRFLHTSQIREFIKCIKESGLIDRYPEVPFVRSVQEGDSIIKEYAAYKRKLLPFIKKQKRKGVVLYGNAFGAMNTSYVLKHLLEDKGGLILCGNVNYSTHRYYKNVFREISSKAVFLPTTESKILDDMCTIIIDDTVWTAGSYNKIISDLGLENTFLLPLTIDCNSLKHNLQLSTSNTSVSELYKIATDSYRLAKEIGDSYPAFFSSWDRLRVVDKYERSTEDESYREVLEGADLLMKHLWTMFFDEYISKEAVN